MQTCQPLRETAGAKMINLGWRQTVIVTAESGTRLLAEVAAQYPSIKLLQTFQLGTLLGRPHRLSIVCEQSSLPSTPVQHLIITNADDFKAFVFVVAQAHAFQNMTLHFHWSPMPEKLAAERLEHQFLSMMQPYMWNVRSTKHTGLMRSHATLLRSRKSSSL